MNLRVP